MESAAVNPQHTAHGSDAKLGLCPRTKSVAACDAAGALMRDFADLERDDGDEILRAIENGQNHLKLRITALLAEHDQ